MAKFIINEGTGGEETVEADQFQNVDGFFYFYAGMNSDVVFAISAKSVMTVARKN